MKRRTSSQNSGVGGSPSNCDIMASGSPDVTDATEPLDAGEECSGKKKSKFQTFKNFFVKKKRKDSPAPSGESGLKASQSSDDVNTSEPTISHANSDNDRGSKINLGSKAMSHDSVFVSDSPLSETNEGLGASQDSIHGKVKSLQLQLKHAICLGSPPSLLCGRKGEDAGGFSDDDGLPCSPPEYSSLHTVLTTPLHASVDLTQSSLSMEASDSEDDQMSCEASSRPATPQGSVPVDFSLPASSVSCLDSSAARHRIAVKANARAKRKPASREMLDKRRDLRERVLLRDTEDKLRMVTSLAKEEREDLVTDSDHESCASGLEDENEDEEEEVTDSSQCPKTSPTSSISAESVSEGEEHVPAEDHVPKSELPESSWESPVTLELQADDFLLDTGCEVVPEEQGSLLEEVLSSLKSPLVSGLALERENMVLQSEVKDINSGCVFAQLEEDDSNDLLDPSNPIVTTEEPAPLPDSLPESSVDSEEISEETTEEEELLEDSESADETHQVPEADADEQVHTAKQDREFFGSPKAFAVNVKERDEDEVHEDVVEEEDELEGETEDGGDDVEKDDEVEPEKTESPTNDEPQEAEGQNQDETSVDDRESVEVNVENVSESDRTVRDDIRSSTETTEACEVLLSTPESPILHSQSCSASLSPLEQESDEPDVSTEPQEESSETREAVSEREGQPVLESPTGEPWSSAEVHPRFTIAPAWQRSLSSGGTQEQSVSPLLPETLEATASSPQTYQLFTPVKEERPVPGGSQSCPSLPTQRDTVNAQEETSPENPFGVRLRKTPVLHRYGLEAESSWTHGEASGAQETPDQDQNARKPVLPKKPDLIVDAVMSARKIPDAVGRICGGGSESPSWISVARQKQKNFMEISAEKLPSQGDDKRPDSPTSLSNPVTKEQLAQPCSPLQVCCSLELSNTSMLEKESKRSADPSAAPLSQDEPPWLALAKKKAKAWSEMPQIVQ